MTPYQTRSSARCAFIGAGSNLGDRLDYLAQAAHRLQMVEGVAEVTSSPVYETAPIGPTGPENFLNAVLRLSVRISPLELWRYLQAIEEELGRPSAHPARAGARTIDLDMLFYDDLVFQCGQLTVPHPRLHQRAFVLVPFCDLAPGFCHPELGLSAAELLETVPRADIIGRIAEAVPALSYAR